MKDYYPMILSRTKAMLFASISRRELEKLAKSGRVRYFTTNGGHRRFVRADLNRYLNEKLQEQQG